MSVDHPVVSWHPMQDGAVFYKRQQLYTVQDKLPNLGDYVVAGCKNGGPIGELSSLKLIVDALMKMLSIAMMRDTNKVIAFGQRVAPFAKNEVRVYSSSGEGLLVFTVRYHVSTADPNLM